MSADFDDLGRRLAGLGSEVGRTPLPGPAVARARGRRRLPRIYRGRGDWSGMAHGAVGYKFSPEVFIYSYFHTSPGTAHYPQGMFPNLAQRATDMTREFDDKRRLEMFKDFEKESAKQMPTLPLGSNGGPSFSLAWPWVVQAPVLRAWPGDGVAVRNVTYSRYWFDPEIARQYGKT